MMRLSRWIAAGLMSATLGMTAGLAQAGGPVVVELYTSQGCSSCPPADAFLARELANRDDVIALALHVDYWDYIGWKDDFADPQHTDRQRDYARAAGQRTIYTPQMIIAGKDHVIGSHPAEVKKLIRAHASAAFPLAILVRRRSRCRWKTAGFRCHRKSMNQVPWRYWPKTTDRFARWRR